MDEEDPDNDNNEVEEEQDQFLIPGIGRYVPDRWQGELRRGQTTIIILMGRRGK